MTIIDIEGLEAFYRTLKKMGPPHKSKIRSGMT